MPVTFSRQLLRRSILRVQTWLRREQGRLTRVAAAEPYKAHVLTAPQMAALGASLARQHRLAKRQRPDALLARLSANARVLQEVHAALAATVVARSEEHTSELQSRENLVCRLLLEKKKNEYNTVNTKRGKI